MVASSDEYEDEDSFQCETPVVESGSRPAREGRESPASSSSPGAFKEVSGPAEGSLSAAVSSSPGTFEEVSALMEAKVSARLALLAKLARRDLHTCCWDGELELVRAHLEVAAKRGGLLARQEQRSAEKRASALEREFAAMGGGEEEAAAGRERRAHGGLADSAEVFMAYESQMADAEAAVLSAKERSSVASRFASEALANAVDATEWGEGYRPLHYAAYRGHAGCVLVLLEHGARREEKNAAGCTALFLACQQGHASCAEHLFEAASESWLDREQLVESGDGRQLCALDAARACDRARPRQQCRQLLLDRLTARNRRAKRDAPPADGKPRKPPAPPTVLCDDDEHQTSSRSPLGGLEVRWSAEHYARPLGDELGEPPVNYVKIKLVSAQDYAQRAEKATAAALLVVRASAHRARFPALPRGRDDCDEETAKSLSGPASLAPTRSYVAMIAGVSGAGAGRYSEPSGPAVARERAACVDAKSSVASSSSAQRHSARAANADDDDDLTGTGLLEGRRVDPKIARARQAVREGREKRQRLARLVCPPRTTQHQHPLSSSPHSPGGSSGSGKSSARHRREPPNTSSSSLGGRASPERPTSPPAAVGPVRATPFAPPPDFRNLDNDTTDDDSLDAAPPSRARTAPKTRDARDDDGSFASPHPTAASPRSRSGFVSPASFAD